MQKSTILQLLAILLFLVGLYSLYIHFSTGNESTSVLSGIGPIMMGVALLVISKSDAIKKVKK